MSDCRRDKACLSRLSPWPDQKAGCPQLSVIAGPVRPRSHWRESGAMRISAPFAGFLSVGLFGRHERKFNRHFKGLFLQAYRQFESPLVRQQVSDVTKGIETPPNYAIIPDVSDRFRESS